MGNYGEFLTHKEAEDYMKDTKEWKRGFQYLFGKNILTCLYKVI